jgi:hypothetical protein
MEIEKKHKCFSCESEFYSKKFIDKCSCGEFVCSTSVINPPEVYQFNGIEFQLPDGCVPVSLSK